MSPLDSARERKSDANRAVVAAENHHLQMVKDYAAGVVDMRAVRFAENVLTVAYAEQDRAEAHLMRMEEVDAHLRGAA
jgi:hypothetical protein